MTSRHRSAFLAFVLIVLGAIFLLQNLGLLSPYSWGQLWPVFLVILGIWLLTRGISRRGNTRTRPAAPSVYRVTNPPNSSSAYSSATTKTRPTPARASPTSHPEWAEPTAVSSPSSGYSADDRDWDREEMAKAMADERWDKQQQREKEEQEESSERAEREQERWEAAQEDREREQEAWNDHYEREQEKWDAIREERDEQLRQKYYGEDD